MGFIIDNLELIIREAVYSVSLLMFLEMVFIDPWRSCHHTDSLPDRNGSR